MSEIKILEKLVLDVPYEKFDCKRDDKKATLTIYDGDFDDNCPAVIVCPGGAYFFLCDREGTPIAEAFAKAGIRPFLLEYSVLPNKFPAALMELSEAVCILKNNAEKFGINKDKVFVSGSSAGGHLAASLAVLWNKPFLSEALDVNMNILKPAGVILSYPVITSGEYTHLDSIVNIVGDETLVGDEARRASAESSQYYKYTSLEKMADKDSARTYIWTTLDDTLVPMENSMLFVQALRNAGVPVEFHLFPFADHGLSLATEEISEREDKCDVIPHIGKWFDMAVQWINIVGKYI